MVRLAHPLWSQGLGEHMLVTCWGDMFVLTSIEIIDCDWTVWLVFKALVVKSMKG